MADLDVSDRPEDHIFCRNLYCIDKLKECAGMLTPASSSHESVSELSGDESNSLLFRTALEEIDLTVRQDVPHTCNSILIGENEELYRPRLPFQLGVLVPGITSTFFLPVHPRIKMLQVHCYLNDRPTKFPCQIASVLEHMSVSLTPPSGARGDILISIDTDFGGTIKLAALCFPPTFALPAILVVPPNQSALVPLYGSFPRSIWLTIKSNLSAPKVINFTPEMKSIPLEIKATPEDKHLKVEIIHDGVLMSVSQGGIKVRPLEVSMTPRETGDSVMITNNETFTVKLALEAETETPLQTLILNLKPGEGHCVKESHFKNRSRVRTREMKLWLKLIHPVEVLIGSSNFLQGQSQFLRPKVPQFMCLCDDITQFYMVEKTSGQPTPWKQLVAIEPCPFIKEYVKVVEDPEDPTSVILQVKKPEKLVFGRLGFFDRNSRGVPAATPYGSRCIFILPDKPRLIIVTAPTEDPLGGKKLRLENISSERIFIKTEAGEIHVLASGTSTLLRMSVGERIWAGSDDLRCIIREKLAQVSWTVNSPIIGELQSNQMMIRFLEEGTVNDEHILKRIPGKPDSLRKLLELLESTLEGIILFEEDEATVDAEDRRH